MADRRALVSTLLGYCLVAAVLVGALTLFEPVSVSGGSMMPALSPGDLAIVRRGAIARRDDIALVKQGGSGPFLHRVVALEAGGMLRTQGDANPIVDFKPVSPDDVAGRVVAVIPVGASIARWRAPR